MKVVDFKKKEEVVRLASDMFTEFADMAKETEVTHGAEAEVVIIYMTAEGMAVGSLSGDADSANMLIDMAKASIVNSQLLGDYDDTVH